jgi:hypothetical protein
MRIYAALADSGAAQGFRFRPPLSISAVRLRDPQGRSPPCSRQEVIAIEAALKPRCYPLGCSRGLVSAGMIVAS